jgi:hypothetical protein
MEIIIFPLQTAVGKSPKQALLRCPADKPAPIEETEHFDF